MASGETVPIRSETEEPGRAGTLMEHTIREIQQYLVRHRLGPGDRIPTERRLAELFGVSRTVVRDAVKTLAAFGIIEVRERVGSFVASMGAEQLGQGLSSRLYINRESMESLLEVRQTLERSTAEWAAAKCEDDGRLRLEAILADNVAAVAAGDIRGFRRTDNRLHVAIAEIAQNAIVLDLLHGVFKYLRSFGVFVEGYGAFVLQCSNEHAQIVDAIGRNDASAARDAMVSHLSSVHAHLLERVEHISD